MFQMAAYNVGDNLKEPITAVHIGQILRRRLEEVLYNIEFQRVAGLCQALFIV